MDGISEKERRSVEKTVTREYEIKVDSTGGNAMDFIDSVENGISDASLKYHTDSYISSLLLDRPQDDLNSYKMRIDANTEQQREHADIMAALQRRIEEYRRRFADYEGKLSLQRLDDSGELPDIRIKDELLGSKYKADEAVDEELLRRFEEERKRVEDMTVMLEQLRIENSNLQSEMHRMRQQFEITIREKEHYYQNREMSLVQHLGDERRKMSDLWSELQRVRRQCSEYREQTERDLENQKNEFVKVMRHVGGVVRGMGGETAGRPLFSEVSSESGAEITQDTTLFETVRRFQDSQGAAPGSDFISEMRLARSDDAGLYNELMKKFEESVERVTELEGKDEENQNKMIALESDFKRNRDRLSECQIALRKVYELSLEHDTNADKKLSPASPPNGYVPPAEVVRSVRYVFKSCSNENNVLQRKLNGAETQVSELNLKLNSLDETRRRLEKLLADSKREIAEQRKVVDDANRNIKTLEDRLRRAEQEKLSADNARKHLEDEMRNMREKHDYSLVDVKRIANEDADDRIRSIEEENRNRISELTRRIDILLEDNKHLKSDTNGLSDRLKGMEIDYSAMVKKLEEKDNALARLESIRLGLANDLEQERAHFDAVTSEFDNLRVNYDSANKNAVAIELTIKEIKEQRDTINAQKEKLVRDIADLENKLNDEVKARENAELYNQHHQNDIENFKRQINEYEEELMAIRRENDDLDTKMKTGQAKFNGLETTLIAAQREIEKLTELNNRHQNDKQSLNNVKQQSENELVSLREKLRKLEAELDRLKHDNEGLERDNQLSREQLNEQLNRASTLERELDDARAEIAHLQRQLGEMDTGVQLKVQEPLQTKPARDEHHTEKIIIQHDKEVYETKYKVEVERLETEKDDLSLKLTNLQDELDEKDRDLERQADEILDLKRKLQVEIENFKNELNTVTHKHQINFDEERDMHQMKLNDLNEVIEELRFKLGDIERNAADLRNNNGILERENNEMRTNLENLYAQIDALHAEITTLKDDAEKDRLNHQAQMKTQSSQMEELLKENDGLKNEIMSADDKINSLNETINDLNDRIRELNATISRLESELADNKSRQSDLESELDSALARMNSIEGQFSSIQIDYNKAKAELDSLLQENDSLKSAKNSSLAEIERLQNKLQQTSSLAREHADALDKLRPERDRLQIIYREQAKETEALHQSVQNAETKLDKLRRELRETHDKLIGTENDRNNLRDQLVKLEQENRFISEQLLHKTKEYQLALDELVDSHRTSEDGRTKAEKELSNSKYEIDELNSRLNSSEQHMITLHQKYTAAENERDMLQNALRRFQLMVDRTTIISKLAQDAKPKDEKETVQLLKSESDADKTLSDVHDLSRNMQNLISRTEALERERNEYRDALQRMQQKGGDSHIKVSKHETIFRNIEDQIGGVGEDKRAMEQRLASAKQLLRSQEEALKQRDDERRQMKNKIAMFETQTRSREAQIRQLNEMIRNLRKDLEIARGDLQVLRDHEEQWDANKFYLESKLKEFEGEPQKISLIVANFETERNTLNEKVRDLLNQLQQSENKAADLKDDHDKLKKDFKNAQNVETDLRRTIEQMTRTTSDYQLLKDQLDSAQNDLTIANNRKQQLENELTVMRSETRDLKKRISDSSSRIAELQRYLSDAENDKKRLNDKLHTLDNTISTHRMVESDLRQQLLSAIGERKAMQNEFNELQRHLSRLEAEKKMIAGRNDELERARMALMKRIEMLEVEKRTAEHIIQESAGQRKAIERSLNELERENRELHRSCTSLQQQIAELELENGNRLIKITSKQRDEHDRLVRSLKSEKVQIEQGLKKRENSLKSHINQLDNQLSKMRADLSQEKRRRQEMVDRIRAGETSSMYTSFHPPVMYDIMDRHPALSLGSYTGSTSLGGVTGMGGSSMVEHVSLSMRSDAETGSYSGREAGFKSDLDTSSHKSDTARTATEEAEGDSGKAIDH